MGNPTRPIHDPAPEAVEAIGKITVAWGRLESTITLAIKSCLGLGFDDGMLQAEEHMKLENMVEELRGLFSLRRWTPEDLAKSTMFWTRCLADEFRQRATRWARTVEAVSC